MARQTKQKQLDKEQLSTRVPRPLGLTYLAQSSQDPHNKQKLKELIIGQWTANSMRFNDKIYTIDQMSTFLNMPAAYILRTMWSKMKDMGKWMDIGESKEIARVLFSQSLLKTLEIQSLIQNQVSLLADSQGDGYKPFISSTLNQAHANLLASQKPMYDLMKVLVDKPDTIIINNAPNGTQTINSLNAEMAMKLINEKQPSMLQDPHLADEQVEKYKQANLLPDINARSQNLTSIGIKHKGIEAEGTSHESRREKQFNIIEDEDEFKA